MKLYVAVERYLARLQERQLSAAHISSVRQRLDRFVVGREAVGIADVTGVDIDAYFNQLRDGGLADGTLAGHKSTQRAFWRWCKKRKLIKKNPAKVLGRKSHQYSYRPVKSRAAAPADFMRVMDSLAGFVAHRGESPRDLRDAALLALAADSSARRGELWELRCKDVAWSLKHGEPLPDGGMVYHVSTRGKTGPVTIRFFAESADLLRRWLGHIPAGVPFVFVNVRTWERLRPDALWLGLKRICEFAGVPVFRFHAIRKRTVTDIIELSGDQKAGQLLANHASARTTQEYYNELQQIRVDVAAGKLAERRHVKGRADGLAVEFFGQIDRP